MYNNRSARGVRFVFSSSRFEGTTFRNHPETIKQKTINHLSLFWINIFLHKLMKSWFRADHCYHCYPFSSDQYWNHSRCLLRKNISISRSYQHISRHRIRPKIWAHYALDEISGNSPVFTVSSHCVTNSSFYCNYAIIALFFQSQLTYFYISKYVN